MFAWHQTFGSKLDVSDASETTATASIAGPLQHQGHLAWGLLS